MNVRHDPWCDALLVAAVAVAVGTGCTGADLPRTSTTIDSAGVTIVESTDPIWSIDEGWYLSPAPSVTIGMMEGPDEYLLDRATSGVRLADGTIVVANSRSLELRFYDSTGSHLFTRGGEGGGPGEFRSMGFLWQMGEANASFPACRAMTSAISVRP